MNFMDLMKERYSVRDFSDQPVEEEKLHLILEAGRLAPTAINAQPQRVFVLKSAEALQKAGQVTRMIYNAPVVLLVCYDKSVAWSAAKYGSPEYISGEMDASIVTTAMMMEATELGLGSLWARAFNAEEMAKAFDLPEEIVPVCLLDLGYPRERTSERRPRYDLDVTTTIL